MSNATYNPPWRQDEHTLYRDLLRECADVLREDAEACANCNYGDGSSGLTSEGEPCEACSHVRDLLKRIEAVT